MARGTIPFTFGPTVIDVFYKDRHTPVLDAVLWYKTASGDNAYKNMTLPNNAAENGQQMVDDFLAHVTGFVRERWFLIEVSTPLHLEYGGHVGGHARMRARRSIL